jgi:hypothetical protein
MALLTGLDWMNLFGGMNGRQIAAVVITFVVFSAAAGLCLLAMIVFGVRAGLMAPRYTTGAPMAGRTELFAYLIASACGLLSILLMIFTGLLGGGPFAELYLDNPLVLPSGIALILAGGLFLMAGLGLGFRAARRQRRQAA